MDGLDAVGMVPPPWSPLVLGSSFVIAHDVTVFEIFASRRLLARPPKKRGIIKQLPQEKSRDLRLPIRGSCRDLPSLYIYTVLRSSFPLIVLTLYERDIGLRRASLPLQFQLPA